MGEEEEEEEEERERESVCVWGGGGGGGGEEGREHGIMYIRLYLLVGANIKDTQLHYRLAMG